MKIIFIALFAIYLSCGDNNQTGPVDINYGQDICERCKMIISEEKFSSQIIMDNGSVYNFDDIGGMIHYLSDNKINSSNLKIYVKDYKTTNWIIFNEAVYVVTDGIKTPMNYGVIAFGEKKDADAFISMKSGNILENFTNVTQHILNNR